MEEAQVLEVIKVLMMVQLQVTMVVILSLKMRRIESKDYTVLIILRLERGLMYLRMVFDVRITDKWYMYLQNLKIIHRLDLKIKLQCVVVVMLLVVYIFSLKE